MSASAASAQPPSSSTDTATFDQILQPVWKVYSFVKYIATAIAAIFMVFAGIKFMTSGNDNINTTTPNGKLLFHVLGAFAEFEREIIRERMMAGIAKSRELGRIIGRVPLGYKVVNKTVIIDDEKAEFIKRIFQAYATGETIWKISKQLQMKPSTISYILKNHFYAEHNKNGKHEPLVSKEIFEAIQPALHQLRKPYQALKPLVTNQNNTVNASPCV